MRGIVRKIAALSAIPAVMLSMYALGRVSDNVATGTPGSNPAVNKYIRDHGGIPPCKWEDGSGQSGMCYWVDESRVHVINVPTRPGHDKRPVIVKRG